MLYEESNSNSSRDSEFDLYFILIDYLFLTKKPAFPRFKHDDITDLQSEVMFR